MIRNQKALPAGWARIGDVTLQLDRVSATQDGYGEFGGSTLIVFDGGGTVFISTCTIPSDFVAQVARAASRRSRKGPTA